MRGSRCVENFWLGSLSPVGNPLYTPTVLIKRKNLPKNGKKNTNRHASSPSPPYSFSLSLSLVNQSVCMCCLSWWMTGGGRRRKPHHPQSLKGQRPPFLLLHFLVLSSFILPVGRLLEFRRTTFATVKKIYFTIALYSYCFPLLSVFKTWILCRLYLSDGLGRHFCTTVKNGIVW